MAMMHTGGESVTETPKSSTKSDKDTARLDASDKEGASASGPALGAEAAAAGSVASDEAAAVEAQRPLDKVSAMGHAVWLMTQSPVHKHLFISDLEWLLMPPIASGQFRLWRKDNMPLAFASWAFLSEETEQRMIAGQQRLAPGAWNSGDRLWLMDLIAPFGGKEEALQELKEKVFPGRTIKSLQPDADGKMRVMEW